jgi:hypothetical protein
VWVFTTRGFYSVVAHRTRLGYVLVRARTREDLEALAHLLRDVTIEEDEGADYRWRAAIKKSEWQDAVARLAGDIDYDNFKNAVAERVGVSRAALYGDVWAVVRGLQEGTR